MTSSSGPPAIGRSCHLTARFRILVPPSTLTREHKKAWYPYFGLLHVDRLPRTLYLYAGHWLGDRRPEDRCRRVQRLPYVHFPDWRRSLRVGLRFLPQGHRIGRRPRPARPSPMRRETDQQERALPRLAKRRGSRRASSAAPAACSSSASHLRVSYFREEVAMCTGGRLIADFVAGTDVPGPACPQNSNST